jgi:hypothetical protein
MKYKIFFLSLIISLLGACNKDTITQNDNQVGESTITYYAVLTLNGQPIMSVVKGTTFTDPGVTATVNGQTIDYTTTGTVDASTSGLYVLTYSAVNKDGYSSSVSRTVVVIDSAPASDVDISGSYSYVGSSTYTSTVAMVAPGVYSTDNCWSGATIIPVIFVCLDGASITIPSQNTGFGPVYGTGTLDNTGKLVYSVSIPNFGITDSKRTWQRN